MNKENVFETPKSTSPELTAEQKARISQKFRAAKALLARKRPFDNLKNECKTGPPRVPLSEVRVNTPSSVPVTCGWTPDLNSIKRPCTTYGSGARASSFAPIKCGSFTEIDSIKHPNANGLLPGDNNFGGGHANGNCRVPLKGGQTVQLNTPTFRLWPERISRKNDEDCVNYEAFVKDESTPVSCITSIKQNEFSESTLSKHGDGDTVSYGLGRVAAPIVDKIVADSYITPMKNSECVNLNDAFSLAAELDDDFDESVLQEIDALCEERSARKPEQHDIIDSDHSGGNHCNEISDMDRMSVESIDAENVLGGALELQDRLEGPEEGSANIQVLKIGSFPQAYSDYLLALNDQQKEAACSDILTPLMIVAGPGSGKTSTMVGRVLMLLNEGIGPTNILAMTFTTAAASEMRDRIGAVTGKEAAKQLMISTFHSFSLQLCRTHADKLGRTSEFLIYGHGQQRRAIIEAMRLFESKKNTGENIDASKLDRYEDMSCANHFKDKTKKWLKFVTKAKASGKTSSECRKMGDEIGASILENYDNILKSCNALDYHDLISCSVNLLTNFPEVCAESQDLWKAMVIDEFQDTSAMQYKLLHILASHNRITIVGDEDQSIFSFNGADVSGFDSFRNDFPNHREIRLTKNYRSTRCIVEAASSVIHQNVNHCRINQDLTDKCSGCKITVKECHNEDAQCAFVVDKILESMSSSSDAKNTYGGVAILYRRQISGKAFQAAFRNRKIPFNVHGVAFYRKKVIKAIMAMLRTTLPGCEDGAFRQTFKALLSCEKEEKKKIVDYIDKISTIRKHNFISVAKELFSAKISGTFKRSQLCQGRKVLSTLDIISKLVHREQSISAVITSVANMLPQKYLLEQRAVIDVDGGKLLNEDNDIRSVLQYLLDDVSEFLANHLDYTEMENRSIGEAKGCTSMLKAFVDYISIRESENFRCRRQDNKDSVTLTTIHQSKGLEWDTVFIVKANETEIPLLHEYNGVVNGNRTSLEEERRLLYVAMTRARKKLYILYLIVDSNWQLLQPSRFLKEIPNHLREVQTELTATELQDTHKDLSRVHVEATDTGKGHEKLLDVQTGAPNVAIVSRESAELLESCSGDIFLKRFSTENRGMISHLFHQWARKKAFEDPKRLLDKIRFVIDERLRINNKKHKDVLRALKSCLSCEEAFQFAQNVVRWEKLPAEKRAHLMREKQEHFQRLRIENSMGSSEATSKQIGYLQSLGCTVVPTSRLHASRLIEQYKSL